MPLNNQALSFSKKFLFFTEVKVTAYSYSDRKLFLRKKSINKYLNNLIKYLNLEQEIKETLKKITDLKNPAKDIRKTDNLKYSPIINNLKKNNSFSNIIKELTDSLRIKFNEKVKNTQKEKFERYFNSVESNPLTDKQRDACISDEANTLVLAGAGSGKTSVMVARIGYLIKSGLAKPNDILALAFNTDAAKELKNRVSKKLSDIEDINKCEISTFHALGNKIYNHVHNREHRIAKHSRDEKLYNKIIDDIINGLLQTDSCFRQDFLEIYNFLTFSGPEISEINNHEEYSNYVKNLEIRSLKGDIVKGWGELEIANFLYINGIDYEYEADYQKITGKDISFKYFPDFYIKNKNLFLEHFGVNRDGSTRPDIDQIKYNTRIKLKRKLHKKNNTSLIETYHFNLKERTLKEKLTKLLYKHKVKFNPIDPVLLYEKINELENRTEIGKEFSKHIAKIRANEITKDELTTKLKTEFPSYMAKKTSDTLLLIKDRYEALLKEKDEYTFDDMIVKSIDYVAQEKFIPKWKYILVDEFQDISPKRAELIKYLRDRSLEASLFCVGDDWQAINGFAGSELIYTIKFNELIGECDIICLDKTFRFDNKLSDVASRFITKNPLQCSKEISTLVQNNSPSVILRAIKDSDYLSEVNDIINGLTENSSVLILERNKLGSNFKLSDLNVDRNKYKIKQMKIHSSKGLEADYVIIKEVTNGNAGIPSLIPNTKITNALLSKDDSFPHSEERRLFYVALTRAKKKCYIITDYDNPSVFIKELLEDNYDIDTKTIDISKLYLPEQCTKCGTDLMKKKNSKTGKVFYACSRINYCGELFNGCLKCGSPWLERKNFYGCTNMQCEYGNDTHLCKCCNKGIIAPFISRSGKSYKQCINKNCINPYQYKCMYCKDVLKIRVEDGYRCNNSECFAKDYKCLECGSYTKKKKSQYGEYYACTSKYCKWTISRPKTRKSN